MQEGARSLIPRLPAILVASLLLAAPAMAAGRDKTDVLVMLNGDHITGEIKGMERGKLDLATDDIGRVSVEWAKVVRVTSTHPYEVELTSGEKVYGTLSSPADCELAVGALPMPDVVEMSTVVQIVPMEDAFLGRIRASFDLGFTFAKANLASTLSTSGEFTYRDELLGTKLDFDVYLQTFKDTPAVSRYTVGLQGDVYFADRWRAVLGGLLEHNDELQLILRVSIAPAVSHSIVRNGWTELWITGGLAGSRESYVNTSGYEGDALLGAQWDAFRYDSPKLDLTTSFVLLPGLSSLGRFRGTFNLKVRYEVFKDFNVGLSFNDTFDTRPPDPDAPKNDFIAALTIGWSYRR
jgi:hypothetical protein